MSYQESFEKIKKLAESLKAADVNGHYAFQFDITGEDEGSFYVEINDGKVICEPYDYKDNNAVISASSEEIIKYFNGEIAVITVNGSDADVLWNVIKASEKKEEAKPVENKAAAAKTETVTKTTPASAKPSTRKPSCRTTSKKKTAPKKNSSK
ncbi:MAG: SCP2 sterol-binding domain-containing protein [Oscillospiraceae bacterium]|nr:SCP2 sterol-binding domain-containing protein [Oscillospiraceae bacterium]